MDFLHVKIDSRIKENSLEYKSLTDFNKSRNIKQLIEEYIYIYISKNLHDKQSLINDIESKHTKRDFFIPIRDTKIYHLTDGNINCNGAVYDKNGKYALPSKDKTRNALQDIFNFYEHFNLSSIRKLSHLKGFIKKWLYIILHPKESYIKRKVLNDKNIPKIMWFESAYKNMYHCIFQYFPSLCMIIESIKSKNIENYFVIVPKKDTYWYGALFEQLLSSQGIDESKRIYLDNCNLKAKNLYFASFPNEIPNIILPTIKNLQVTFIKEKYPLDFGTRLYISRKKSSIRFLVNEDEIKNILEREYGFKTIYMEDYNLEEKINIMYKAEVVISIDGTSLVNALFSTKKCKMIGLRLHSLTEHMFIMSAMFENISYLPIICDIAEEIINPNSYNNDAQWHLSNLYLNPKYLREKLEIYEVNKI